MRGHTNFNRVALLFIPLLWSYACASVDAYVARFSGFLCFVFVLPCAYAYVANENQVLSLRAYALVEQKQIKRKILSALSS